MTRPGSVRHWISGRNAALRISRTPLVQKAREIDTAARLAQEQAAIAAHVGAGLVKKLPAAPASAPAIAPIRESISRGIPIIVNRGRGRTITFFNPETAPSAATYNPGVEVRKQRPVQDEGGLSPRRRKTVAKQRNQRLR
jgi:hypothetical protein